MEEATGFRVAAATQSLCDTQERLLHSRNISDSSSSILAAPLGSFFTDFVAELSFPAMIFQKGAGQSDKITPIVNLLDRARAKHTTVDIPQCTVVLTSLFAFQFISQSPFFPLSRT